MLKKFVFFSFIKTKFCLCNKAAIVLTIPAQNGLNVVKSQNN